MDKGIDSMPTACPSNFTSGDTVNVANTQAFEVRAAQAQRPFLQTVVTSLRAAYARWEQYRTERAVRIALSRLDAATLRDLGFEPSEVSSVAAEVSGSAELTRARIVRA